MLKKQRLNLNGLRVLNTRPQPQGQALNQAINEAGGQAISCPALTICAIPPTFWLPSLPPLSTIKQVIFTSVNAVNCFFDGLKKQSIDWPKSIIVIAIGPSTAKALTQYRIPVHSTPSISDSEHLLVLPPLQQIERQHILLVTGEGGRTLIAETLTARGCNLTILKVYFRARPQLNNTELTVLWRNNAIDIILFTSQEAMHNLFILLNEPIKTWLQQKPCLVISPRLAQAASLIGMKPITVCRPDTIIETLHQLGSVNKLTPNQG